MRQVRSRRRFVGLRGRLLLGAGWVGLGVTAAAPAVAADQLVAFDETYVQELNGNVQGETFHHGIKPAPTEPASWTTPVNYAKGTAYLYMEVLEKPSTRNTLLTVCFDGPKEGYGCFDTKNYTDVGAYETKVTMGGGSWYQYNKVAWGQRRDDYHLVIKDPALNGIQGGKPATDYVPTKVRVVLTIVPPGGTYTPPPKGTVTDGGVATTDAPGSGGASGQGGASAADATQATGGSGGSSNPAPDPAATGGSSALGGSPGSGNNGGNSGNGGAGPGGTGNSGGNTGSGGSPPSPAASGGSSATSDDEPPPACSAGRFSPATSAPSRPFWLLLAAAAITRRRRRPLR